MVCLYNVVSETLNHRCFQNDKRFIVYDHIPEQRIKLLRVRGLWSETHHLSELYRQEYLSELTPPSLSVHVSKSHP